MFYLAHTTGPSPVSIQGRFHLHGDMPPGRGPHGRFPGRRFHVAVSAKDVSQVAVKFIDVNDFQ